MTELNRRVTVDTAIRQAPVRIALKDGKQLTGTLRGYGRTSISITPDEATMALLGSTWKVQSVGPHQVSGVYQA